MNYCQCAVYDAQQVFWAVATSPAQTPSFRRPKSLNLVNSLHRAGGSAWLTVIDSSHPTWLGQCGRVDRSKGACRVTDRSIITQSPSCPMLAPWQPCLWSHQKSPGSRKLAGWAAQCFHSNREVNVPAPLHGGPGTFCEVDQLCP